MPNPSGNRRSCCGKSWLHCKHHQTRPGANAPGLFMDLFKFQFIAPFKSAQLGNNYHCHPERA
jgi:hypothetical protein